MRLTLRLARLAVTTVIAAASLAGGARAQTLNLGGVPPGPTLPEANACAELATSLETEARVILQEADALAGEAKAGAAARARFRSLTAYLLRSGSVKPWDESAPAVDGARLSQLTGRVDRVIELAIAGRAVRERELSPSDAKRAMALVHALGGVSIEQVRRALVSPQDRLASDLARALSATLAPLAELSVLLEGVQNDDPWPVLVDARASRPDRSASPTTAADVDAAVRALPPSTERDALAKASADWVAAQSGPQDLAVLAQSAEAIRWLGELRAAGAATPMEQAAVSQALARIATALGDLANPAESARARASLEALSATLPAARAMLDLRRTDGLTDSARRALSDGAAALLAPDAGTLDRERERARAAARIADACACADRLEKSLVAAAPKDLRDLLRQFDRDARVAVRSLPQAFQAIASDPASAVEPGNSSALERVRSIEADRARIVALQSMIDSIGAIKPAAGRDFATVAKRMTKFLTDPLKRSEGQAAFAALESQFSAAFPFAYEDELKRRTPRATELAGGSPEKVIERAAAVRVAWCDAIGSGDFGGDASRRLDLTARLCRSLRDLDQVIDPIDRAAGDRLAMWGPWPTRRAMIAPATQDLVARAALASRSFVAANSADGRATFERDLAALETAIPLVRLAAGLERKVSPTLRGDPDTLGAQLAPLITPPAAGAYLASEWGRLLALHRAMVELEHARRNGEPKLRDALNEYLAAVAREIEHAALGAPRPVTRVPGFDGTQGDDASEGRGKSQGKNQDKNQDKSQEKNQGKNQGKPRDRSAPTQGAPGSDGARPSDGQERFK